MEIKFKHHAEIKIAQRKIPKEFVYKTLSKPYFIHYQSTGRDQYFRKFTKLYLKVVAVKVKSELVVITVHWVDKVPGK